MENDLLNAIEKLIDKKLTSNTEKDYLDVQETCFFLGISKSHLYKLNYRKVIPFFKPTGSKKVYYLKTDLVKYLTENRFMSKSEMESKTQSYFQNSKVANYVR